ncbi:MAG: substrate-binding domain-containing protein, partial [Caulobacterales bacterium]|nr:substrate-binding domain-containing protein [Caulobacterales bacterium]
MSKRVTMAELARAAEVDISTVSRALSDSPLVKSETKAQILRIAADMGYVVNAPARRLRRRSSEAIGMVIPMRPDSGQSMSDPFYLEMVGAVSAAASGRGYDLIISVPAEEGRIAERRLLQAGKADGLIVIGQAGIVDRLNALGALTDRVVVWGGAIGGASYTVVGSDNVRGGELAVEHLFERGRERVLFIGETSLPEVRLRYEGLERAHKVAGRAHDPQRVLHQEFGGQDAFEAVMRFIADGPPFDAVFAASDVLAIAAIHALRASGRSVPEDVSVVGYDNIGQSSMTLPGLTTID